MYRARRQQLQLLAEQHEMSFRPGVLIFDEGKLVRRHDSLIYTFHFSEGLRFIAGGHYRTRVTAAIRCAGEKRCWRRASTSTSKWRRYVIDTVSYPALTSAVNSSLKITVNGVAHELQVDPDTPLIYVLRNDLQLKGTKLGCALEQCGACRVLVDGQPAYACATPVGAFAGRSVTTIEGIGSATEPHPIQQAFIDERAAQCGYCIPGIVVATRRCSANPDPADGEIRAALAGHLRRCGSHVRILKAVRRRRGCCAREPAAESPGQPARRPDQNPCERHGRRGNR